MKLDFTLPTRLFTGKGCLKENAASLTALGKKALIVTGRTSAVKSGALDDVKDALSSVGISYALFDKIEQNPTFSSCKEASLAALREGADFVLGIGGGSPLDAAKAIAVLATDEKMTSTEMYAFSGKTPPLPIVAVGTTAGTGSEVTPVAVITTDGLKKSLRHNLLFPAFSFGDPTYTLSLPLSFTRSTAIDALAHCIESYFNRTANDVSRLFALRGVSILLSALPKLGENDPIAYETREELYIASLYGGLAISVTGTAFPHAMSYFLSEKYGVAHGTACGAYLPAFLRYNEKEVPTLYREFCAKLGTDTDALCALIRENSKKPDITLSQEEISALLPRYHGNGSFKKCFGNADETLAKELLEALFAK